ncbi:MAG: hypothetical protein NZM28_10005, partial [Fimbriimonadales bacterium]|nr:hypothetical protein [Fimbriimonadales bacterium]
ISLLGGALWLTDALKPSSGLYVGMTRLRGAHFVYGLIAERLPRTARALSLYLAPLLWVLGAAVGGGLLRGLWYALVCAAYAIALAPLLLTLVASSQLDAATEQPRSPAEWLRLIGFALVAAVLFAILPLLPSADLIPLPANPLEWLGEAVWWVSLIPPLFIPATLWVDFHPLWGVPQIGLTAYVAWQFTRTAARRLESFRRLRETPQAAQNIQEAPGEWG